MRTSNIPLLACSLGEGVEFKLDPWGYVRMCPEVRLEGWLRWLITPLNGGIRMGHAQYSAFAPGSSEVAEGIFAFIVQNLSWLCMHVVIFSPLEFLCISLLSQKFVHVQALQQRVPGPKQRKIMDSCLLEMMRKMLTSFLFPSFYLLPLLHVSVLTHVSHAQLSATPWFTPGELPTWASSLNLLQCRQI